MKRFLFYLFAIFYSVEFMAQNFTVNNSDGMPLKYTVTSTNPNEVKLTGRGTIPTGYTLGTELNVPATVFYGGSTYNVVEIAQSCFFQESILTKVNLPEGIRTIGSYAVFQSSIYSISIPSTLTKLEENALIFMAYPFSDSHTGARFLDMDFSKTSITEFPTGSVYIGSHSKSILRSVSYPATTQIMSEDQFSHDYDTPPIIYLYNSIPATLTVNMSSPYFGQKNPFRSATHIYVPIDATKIYEDNTDWAKYKGRYYEQVKIGPNGYTSYYLENENFEVPVGCTAYIIKNVTQQGSTRFGKTTDVAIAAGSVIPKQTGFILKGTAGSTVTYRANLTGVTEVDVTGNLLVGTAVEKEFNGAGYKYYLFGKGAVGQGFYYQTGRDGNSIKLPAHRAGLKLSASGPDFAPAKELIFNFDDATTTGINTVQPAAEKKNDVIYDLQGRRVTNPSRGIYIVNGKKVVISK